uniref:SEC7 domain-containing protein n=1 Tax=Romanomermis culicivorax TaxID=13658 RepID=A0A915KC16_ROMCU
MEVSNHKTNFRENGHLFNGSVAPVVELSKVSSENVSENGDSLGVTVGPNTVNKSPRYEAFLMTGDKMLRLNPKISPNYAQLKQSQLPKHTQVLDISPTSTTVLSVNSVKRTIDGPFSDVENCREREPSPSPNITKNLSGSSVNKTSKIQYKYLQDVANLRVLNEVTSQLPASHSENILRNGNITSDDEIDASKSNFFALGAEEVTLASLLIFSPKLRKFSFKILEPTRNVAVGTAHQYTEKAGAGSIVTVHGRLCPSDTDTDTGLTGIKIGRYNITDVPSPVTPSFFSEPTSPARTCLSPPGRKTLRTEVRGDYLPSNFSDGPSCSYDINATATVYNNTSAEDEINFSRKDEVDAAKRLAKRLFSLDGFSNNEFGSLVSSEYVQLFNFAGLKIDAALRKFLTNLCLIGETSDRERILAFFSRRYYQCNPSLFNSECEVHALTCAIVLLNTDLHNQNLSKHMTSREFIFNVTQTGFTYSTDLLKSLYLSIKCSPLPLEPSTDSGTTSINSHFLNRSQFVDTPFVDDESGNKKGFFQSARNVIRVHHALAVRATDYSKKQHVFRLQTASLAEYYFQTRVEINCLYTFFKNCFCRGDPRELHEWIDAINFVAACFSSPALSGAVSSRQSFYRPFLTSAPSKLSIKEQLEVHEARVLDIQKQLSQHRRDVPCRSARARILQAYAEKEIFLIYELERYSIYARLLRPKVEELLDACSSSLPAILRCSGRMHGTLTKTPLVYCNTTSSTTDSGSDNQQQQQPQNSAAGNLTLPTTKISSLGENFIHNDRRSYKAALNECTTIATIQDMSQMKQIYQSTLRETLICYTRSYISRAAAKWCLLLFVCEMRFPSFLLMGRCSQPMKLDETFIYFGCAHINRVSHKTTNFLHELD